MKGCHLEKWLIPGSVLIALLSSNLTLAQVVGDTTLPTGERSLVTGNPNFQIDGGATRGGNLFHSFSQFSIPTGGSAFFNNAADVQNILTRVTGGSISNIDGLIRANGTANLFLLNPWGIIFSANASLNVGGSFIATTADAIGLANGDIFSANPGQSLPSQVLNVNPNAFFFNQLASQSIINRSTANNRTGLQVPPGQSLLLVGGTIRLEGGQIVSPSSRVELGTVAGQGIVGLSGTAGDWQLSFPNGVARADVFLSNRSLIDVRGGGGGSIAITAGNLTLNQGSTLWVGIKDGLGFAGAQAGDMQLDATGTINLADDSLIANRVGFGSTGNAGNINITTGSLSVAGNAQVGSDTLGQGNAGSININARDTVSWDGNGVIGGTAVQPTAVGNAGDFNITTGSLFVTNVARLGSVTRGQGDTGSVNIVARDSISLDGSGNNYSSLIGSGVDPTGVGNSGGINITTGSLSLTNGAQVSSYTFGQGDTGSVNIVARDSISLDGVINSAYTTSGIFSQVRETAAGNSGGINITTGSLSLTNNSVLVSNTYGQGDAGNVTIAARDTVSLDKSAVASNVNVTGVGNGGAINITTGSLSVTGGSQLISSTLGQGDAGNVTIAARDTVTVDGENPNGLIVNTPAFLYNSAISTTVNSGAQGQGGNVTIATGALFLTNGGVLNTFTEGQGNAGRVTINARDSVQIRGTAPTQPDRLSGVFTSATSESVGDGGDVIITTGSLSVSDQGRINTNAQGQGNAGNIQIQADDTVSFNSGDSISTLEQGAVGKGGDIEITARSLSVFNGAQLSSATSGAGSAGKIAVSADTVGLSSGGRLLTTTSSNGRAGDIIVGTPDLQLSGATSGLFAETASAGDAGDLTIQPRGDGQSVRVNLQDGAQISASTQGSGQGGTLMITAPDSITLTGNGSIIAAETGGSGAGGNLNLKTGTLNIQNQAQVTVSSSGAGSAGNLFVDANQIYLDNQGRIRADTSGGGGNINLRSPLIVLRNGSSITTDARGRDIRGGDIRIDTDNLVAVPSENSDISANSANFRGGNVTVRASGIFGIEFREQITPLSDITATGVSEEFSGTVDIITPGIDPARGLAGLPTEVVDASDEIAQGCRDVQGSSFVVSGRGGLPPTPQQALGDDPRWRDWRTPAGVSRQPNTPANGSLPPSANPPGTKSALVEATGWVIEPSGKVILTASAPNAISSNRWGQPVNCNGS